MVYSITSKSSTSVVSDTHKVDQRSQSSSIEKKTESLKKSSRISISTLQPYSKSDNNLSKPNSIKADQNNIVKNENLKTNGSITANSENNSSDINENGIPLALRNDHTTETEFDLKNTPSDEVKGNNTYQQSKPGNNNTSVPKDSQTPRNSLQSKTTNTVENRRFGWRLTPLFSKSKNSLELNYAIEGEKLEAAGHGNVSKTEYDGKPAINKKNCGESEINACEVIKKWQDNESKYANLFPRVYEVNRTNCIVMEDLSENNKEIELIDIKLSYTTQYVINAAEGKGFFKRIGKSIEHFFQQIQRSHYRRGWAVIDRNTDMRTRYIENMFSKVNSLKDGWLKNNLLAFKDYLTLKTEPVRVGWHSKDYIKNKISKLNRKDTADVLENAAKRLDEIEKLVRSCPIGTVGGSLLMVVNTDPNTKPKDVINFKLIDFAHAFVVKSDLENEADEIKNIDLPGNKENDGVTEKKARKFRNNTVSSISKLSDDFNELPKSLQKQIQ